MFEKNCAFWTEGHSLILEALKKRKEQYFQLRLEDLANTEKLKEFFDFMNIKMPANEKLERIRNTRVNAKEEAMWTEIVRIKEKVGIKMLPQYADWSEQEKIILKRICGDVALKLGYNA